MRPSIVALLLLPVASLAQNDKRTFTGDVTNLIQHLFDEKPYDLQVPPTSQRTVSYSTAGTDVEMQLRIFKGDSPVVLGTERMMSQKEFGTSAVPIQKKLRWTCDEEVADKICNYNRHSAEFAGYWEQASTFLQEESEGSGEITFYDSNTGKPLFYGPRDRSFSDFVSESQKHGWPSFRDSEVNWEYVRLLPNGECISVDGTHLGHNIPDWCGNRYCARALAASGRTSAAQRPTLIPAAHATRARVHAQASISSRSQAGRSIEMRCGPRFRWSVYTAWADGPGRKGRA